MEQVSLDGCFVLSQGTQLTVSNLANADDNCYIQIRLYLLMGYNGTYGLDGPYYSLLTKNGGFVQLMQISPSDFEDRVMLRPGESVTFSLSEYATIYDYDTGEEVGTFDLLVLSPELIYSETGQGEQAYYGFVF